MGNAESVIASVDNDELAASLLEEAQRSSTFKKGEAEIPENKETQDVVGTEEKVESQVVETPQFEEAEIALLSKLGLDQKTVADIKAGKTIPQHRLDEVLGKVKKYEAFGTPEQLKEKLAPPKSLEKRAELTETQKADKEYMDSLRKEEIERINRMEETMTLLEREALHSWQDHNNKGFNVIRDFAVKEMGINPKDQSKLEAFSKMITAPIVLNKELYDRFYENRDMNVIHELLNQFKEMTTGVRTSERASIVEKKGNLSQIPKKVGSGGIVPSGTVKKNPADMSWAELREVATQFLDENSK